MQIIDEFVERSKLNDQEDIVFEKRMQLHPDSSPEEVSEVMKTVDDVLQVPNQRSSSKKSREPEYVDKVSYVSKGQRYEGTDAVRAFSSDLKDMEAEDEESDQEILEMVSLFVSIYIYMYVEESIMYDNINGLRLMHVPICAYTYTIRA